MTHSQALFGNVEFTYNPYHIFMRNAGRYELPVWAQADHDIIAAFEAMRQTDPAYEIFKREITERKLASSVKSSNDV